MKANLIFLAAMAITVFATGQNQKVNNDGFVNPVFKCNGTLVQGTSFETIDEFLVNFVNYPFESIKCAKQGTEVVRFTVTPAGEITNVTVINSICPKVDQEVIRVLGLTNGKWQAGTVNDVKVHMEKEVSIAFKMRQSNDFTALAKDCLEKGNQMQMKGNLKKALKFYDQAVNFSPCEPTILAARGISRYEIGDEVGANQDWTRLNKLGFFKNNINNNHLEEVTVVEAFK